MLGREGGLSRRGKRRSSLLRGWKVGCRYRIVWGVRGIGQKINLANGMGQDAR